MVVKMTIIKPYIQETPGHSTRCWSKKLSRLFYPGTAAHPLHSTIDPSKPLNDFLNIVGLSISVPQMKKSKYWVTVYHYL